MITNAFLIKHLIFEMGTFGPAYLDSGLKVHFRTKMRSFYIDIGPKAEI